MVRNDDRLSSDITKKDKGTDNWLINNTEKRTLLIGWVRDR